MAQQRQLQPVSLRLECFLKYINFKPVDKADLELALDYVDSNLNGNLVSNYEYWHDMFSYCIKNFSVLRHKEKITLLFL